MLQLHRFGKTPDDIDMFYLVSNKSPKAIPFIEERLRDGRFRINAVGQDQRHEMILAALSSHPHACHILRENPDAIFIEELCDNPSQEGLLLLREYNAHELIVWPIVARNPAIGEYECEILRRILRNRGSRVRRDGRSSIQSSIIYGLAKNPAPEAMRLFFEHFSDEMYWDHLHYIIATNPAPEAIALLERHLDRHIERSIPFRISRNEAAVHILEAHPELIDLEMLCYNPCAVHLVEERLDEMTATAWLNLCMNPSHAALDLLAQHPDKITWNYLSMNPIIFEDWDFADANTNNGGLYILK